jgi:hypothetical protein
MLAKLRARTAPRKIDSGKLAGEVAIKGEKQLGCVYPSCLPGCVLEVVVIDLDA